MSEDTEVVRRKFNGLHNGVKKGKEFAHPTKPNDKMMKKLELRKKFDAEHGTHKGKHLHTVPGSMKKGGGF